MKSMYSTSPVNWAHKFQVLIQIDLPRLPKVLCYKIEIDKTLELMSNNILSFVRNNFKRVSNAYPTYSKYKIPDIGLAVRVFTNGPGDLGSIPGRVIPKTQKMVLDASLLNTQHYKVRIKGKVKQSREGVAPSPTPWCSSYRKGSLRVTLDCGRQLYLLIYI